MTEVNSYLYLHPSENPAISLVSPVLDDANYHSWSRSMLTALSAKNKIEFVLGNLRPPATDKPEHAAWIRGNNMVVSWLVHSVSTNIRQSIIWMNKASEIWADIKNRFSQGSLSRISSLQHDIATLHQGDLTTSDYFTKRPIMWDEIENFRSEPVCTCKPDCDCQVLKILKQRKQEDQVMQFLRGLNDRFNNVTSHVLLLDPLLDITKQERQFSSGNLVAAAKIQDNNNSNNVTAYTASTSSTACNYCGKYGHSEATETPETFRIIEDNALIAIRVAILWMSAIKSMDTLHDINSTTRVLRFTKSLFKKTMELLKTTILTIQNQFVLHHNSSKSWLISSKTIISTTPLLQPKFITLALSLLTKPFQAIQTKEKISIVKLTGGLYVSDFSSNLPIVYSVNNTVNDTGLWHMRLGHPSDVRLHTLKLKYPFIVHHLTYICDTCHRINHQTTCSETPQQNGIVERKHQHLLNVTRSLLFQANLPTILWCFAAEYATLLINCMPTPLLNNATPYEKLNGKLYDISVLRVFGCLCYVSTLAANRKKLDARAVPGVFLGFKQHTKGYQFLNLQSHKIDVSRNVMFHEDCFPYTSSHNSIHDSNSLSLPIPHNYHHDYDNVNFPNNRILVPTPNDPIINTNEDNMEVQHTADPYQPTAFSDDVNIVHEHNDTIRRSTQSKRPPAYLTDFQTHNIARYPITDFISYNKFSSDFRNTVLSISSTTEPRTYKEASKIPQWTQAMQDELKALGVNNTWIITDLPLGKTAIGCRWIYKIKHKHDGSIDRFKARLVAKGYTQLEGLDYLETFAPVAKLTTLRLLLAIAASNKWILKQLDVNNAFLHGDLHEEVYMQPPPGLPIHKPNQVCKLQRSLYGLKQAGRQWYDKLSTFLLSNNYIRSNADHSLFLKHDTCHTTTIFIYVDDIVLSGNNAIEIQHITTSLDNLFHIKNLGDLTYFLGLEVARNSSGIHLSQRKYILDLLTEAGMLNCAPMPTPMAHSSQLSSQGDLLNDEDASSYRRLIGRLIYLTNTRPDITFFVNNLSQFVSAPTALHQQAANRILRYLKGSPDNGIFLQNKNTNQLKAYSDSDWATCPESRKSITGYSIYFGNSIISWKSKKQQTISRSSSEVEYRALAHVTCELQWLTCILQDLRISIAPPATVYCDNRSAIQIANNQVFHERTKHIEIDCHIVREKINNGLIKLLPISTNEQAVDLFTKPLAPSTFKYLKSKLGMTDIYSQLEGG
ncbi:hypothetical protein V8G54_009858 [Vigna mungo]|uniref:Retrovirus-related Pol polyprotein from transposon TNT 1-94 n=1 Tax=Vigna mungo TaxID=3915 RepID=A0AAQ3S5V8_VIGMU